MRLKDKTAIVFNSRITIKGIPLEAYEYMVNGKSAIEWVMDRYQVTKDKVSAIVDDRTILVTHANWSPIDGRRGQVERDVKVIDVSESGDWTAVRVWYAPSEDLGSTAWPVHGFIYPSGSRPPAPIRQAPSPKLEYASVLAWTAHLGDAKRPTGPTGRLTYLGSMLPKLAKVHVSRD